MSYERDMSNEEIIINRLEKIYDKLDELLEFESDTFGLKTDVRKLDDETKKDYPSGITRDQHLKIQHEGLDGATEELLKQMRVNNQREVNESIYCALMRVKQILDNLEKRIC